MFVCTGNKWRCGQVWFLEKALFYSTLYYLILLTFVNPNWLLFSCGCPLVRCCCYCLWFMFMFTVGECECCDIVGYVGVYLLDSTTNSSIVHLGCGQPGKISLAWDMPFIHLKDTFMNNTFIWISNFNDSAFLLTSSVNSVCCFFLRAKWLPFLVYL